MEPELLESGSRKAGAERVTMLLPLCDTTTGHPPAWQPSEDEKHDG